MKHAHILALLVGSNLAAVASCKNIAISDNSTSNSATGGGSNLGQGIAGTAGGSRIAAPTIGYAGGAGGASHSDAAGGVGGSLESPCAAPMIECVAGDSQACETNSQTSEEHCGKCGNRCAPGTFCISGSCSAARAGVAAGDDHTCMHKVDGSVYCWGKNEYGRLGDGSTTDSLVPVAVATLGGAATRIGVGLDYSCAVVSGIGLRCWGNNGPKQLGMEAGVNFPDPTTVPGLTEEVQELGLGAQTACVILKSGKVDCWGLNYPSCQAGQYQGGITIPAPKQVPALPVAITGLVSGAMYSLAVSKAGALYGWGAVAATRTEYVPVPISGFSGAVVAAGAGEKHACAVLATGEVQCFGNNDVGQLGNGMVSTTPLATPVTVVGLPGKALQVVAGLQHSCARLESGYIYCWGSSAFGQLGNNTQTESKTPVLVGGLPTVAKRAFTISAGKFHNCAVWEDESVQCWGSNSIGQLGTGDNVNRMMPVNPKW